MTEPIEVKHRGCIFKMVADETISEEGAGGLYQPRLIEFSYQPDFALKDKLEVFIHELMEHYSRLYAEKSLDHSDIIAIGQMLASCVMQYHAQGGLENP